MNDKLYKKMNLNNNFCLSQVLVKLSTFHAYPTHLSSTPLPIDANPLLPSQCQIRTATPARSSVPKLSNSPPDPGRPQLELVPTPGSCHLCHGPSVHLQVAAATVRWARATAE